MLEQAMKLAREEVLHAPNRRNPNWYQARQQQLDPLVQDRNAKQEAYNRSRGDSQIKGELQRARAKLKREVRAAEKAWIDAVVADVNGLHQRGNVGDGRQLSPKECWEAVKQLQAGMNVKVTATAFNFKTPDGNITSNSEEAAKVMGDYQASVFSKQGIFDPAAVDGVRQRPQRPEMDRPPTFEEYLSAVRGLNNNKAPGDDGNFAELYKALIGDETTERYLYDVIAAFWKSGSFPGDDAVVISKVMHEPTLKFARKNNWKISFVQENPKKAGSMSYSRYDGYKKATSFDEALLMGAKTADFAFDLSHSFLKLHDPELEQPRSESSTLNDSAGLVYEEWLVARLKLLPKKGDLTQCKNWRGICLLDVASKVLSSILVQRMQSVLKEHGLEMQTGFTPDRGTIDGMFTVLMALAKRKEHNLDTFCLFIDLQKAFDSVPRASLFKVLRRFGLPAHFVNIVIRLHEGAKIKLKIGEAEKDIASTIGVRQGSCEGPVLFLFIMQAAMETLVWPDGVSRPEFRTVNEGKTMGEKWNRKRGATSFELWASLFADDCAVFFNSREELVIGTQHLFTHLRKFGLEMHVGRGSTASKTEAMFCPRPRRAYEDGNTERFAVDGDGFVEFTREFKYLGSIISSELTSDADVDKRIKSATAIFGALSTSIFKNKDLSPLVKGRIYVTLVLSVLLYGSECWSLREDLFDRLNSFHNRCVRTMCRITIAHTIRCHIRSESLYERVGIRPLRTYYELRLLRWAGHLARMDMSRLPRKLLTGWVAHPRPNGCPLMNWGRTLKKALKSRDIATVFTTWTKLAQNRSSWRQLIGDTTAAPTGPTARDERAARRNLRNNAPA
jgi:hypothetical protein